MSSGKGRCRGKDRRGRGDRGQKNERRNGMGEKGKGNLATMVISKSRRLWSVGILPSLGHSGVRAPQRVQAETVWCRYISFANIALFFLLQNCTGSNVRNSCQAVETGGIFSLNCSGKKSADRRTWLSPGYAPVNRPK